MRRLLVIVSVALTAACGSENPGGSHTAPSSPSSTPPTVSAQLTGEWQYQLTAPPLGLRLWKGHAAWISGGQGPRGDEVMVLDLATREAKVVATVPPSHAVDYVAGDGDMVVYVELEGRPTDDNPEVIWTMKSVDIVRGSTATLATSSGLVHYALAPSPSIREPWVAWAEPIPVPEGQRVDTRIMAYNLRTQRRVTLAGPVGSFAVAVAGSTVLYEQNQPAARTSYDIYSKPADGSASPDRLTDMANAKQPFAGDGWIGWNANSSGYTAVWIMQYDPRTGKHGPPDDIDPRSEGNARLGKGFVMWLAFGGPLQLQPLPAAANDKVLSIATESEVNLAGNWDASGDTIAWTAVDAQHQLSIRVATVVIR